MVQVGLQFSENLYGLQVSVLGSDLGILMSGTWGHITSLRAIDGATPMGVLLTGSTRGQGWGVGKLLLLI